MKRLLIFIAFVWQLGFINNVFSQQTYYFKYDVNGNRITRSINYNSTLKSTANKVMQQEKIEEVIDELKVTVYPNPTQGEITVELEGFEEQQSSITLYDFQGKLLRIKENLSEINDIDISEFPNAIYLLRISVGNKITEYKVVKQ